MFICILINAYLFSNLEAKKSNLSAEASFGSVKYQELILFRTETVMELLLLGFR
jgi:hypothetical protein